MRPEDVVRVVKSLEGIHAILVVIAVFLAGGVGVLLAMAASL